MTINRRDLMIGAAAVGGLAMPSLPAWSQSDSGATGLPPRGNFVIRNAYVMTMDRGMGDIKDGDVHVRDGDIIAVGQKIDAAGATAIDGRGMIVLPGLVETHWHIWNTLIRGMSGEKPEYNYYRTAAMLGAAFQPEDMYRAMRLSMAEAINSGITFVHDWCHNLRSPEHARADLRGLKESGVRARFSYGAAQGQPNNKTIDLADLEGLQRDWSRYSNEDLISLGMAWRGQGGNLPANAVPEEVWKVEFGAAQRLKLPLSVHSSGAKAAVGQIAGLSKAGMLHKDVQIIHAGYASADEINMVKEAGASVSIAPTSELRIGFGLPQTSNFINAGVPVGLSIDNTELVGNADMFVIMKTIQNVENGRAEDEFKLSARRTLELATIEGARSMGIDNKVGSLTPGKRADIIMVQTRALNLAVFGDPAVMLVTAAQPSNVDTVIVDGRILKRDGKLTAVNTEAIIDEAAASSVALRKRANWW